MVNPKASASIAVAATYVILVATPVPEPKPVAINLTPISFEVAPIAMKSVVPTLSII